MLPPPHEEGRVKISSSYSTCLHSEKTDRLSKGGIGVLRFEWSRKRRKQGRTPLIYLPLFLFTRYCPHFASNNRFLKGSGRPNLHHSLCWNFDFFTRLGISTYTVLPLTTPDLPMSGRTNAPSFLVSAIASAAHSPFKAQSRPFPSFARDSLRRSVYHLSLVVF